MGVTSKGGQNGSLNGTGGAGGALPTRNCHRETEISTSKSLLGFPLIAAEWKPKRLKMIISYIHVLLLLVCCSVMSDSL